MSSKSLSFSKKHAQRSTQIELQREALERKKLLKMTNKQLIKQCKKYNVAYNRSKKKETLDRLREAMKKQNKAKKKKKKHRHNQSNISLILMQSITHDDDFSITIECASDAGSERANSARSYVSFSDTESFINGTNGIDNFAPITNLDYIDENKVDVFESETIAVVDDHDHEINESPNQDLTRVSVAHSNTSSIASLSLSIAALAPKMSYQIPGLHSFDTIKEVKQKLPMSLESGQCKLFYNGYELCDSDTLSQLRIRKGCTVKLLLSWNYFRPELNTAHGREIEHEHLDKVCELKRLNDLEQFKMLVADILRNTYNVIQENILRMLHGYCICLSGERTYDRKWTALHSMCYDYPNDIEMVVDLLMKYENKLYIDAWPHSGSDTPLRLAINRANPNEKVSDEINKMNAKGAVELVEFLVINGARRMIRQTVVNLKRTVNDVLYSQMDECIRNQLIEILEPYVDEDPFKPKVIQLDHDQ